MFEITASVTINRPPEVVFNYLTDLEKLPEWAAGVAESRQTTPGPKGVGTTYQIVGKVMGRRVPSAYTVSRSLRRRARLAAKIQGCSRLRRSIRSKRSGAARA